MSNAVKEHEKYIQKYNYDVQIHQSLSIIYQTDGEVYFP